MEKHVEQRPGWREPMFWLVWGLPAIVVVAGISTLVIAIRAGGADAVPMEVRRTAQIQIDDLRADHETLRLGLQGELLLQVDTGAVQVVLHGSGPPADEQLRLRLRHPGEADLDRELTLVRGGDSWYGRLPDATGNAWNIELSPGDGHWRLTGRLEPGARTTPLRPRLPG